MKILFTGASSFTGLWFVQELAKAGHSVTAPLRSSFSSYSGLRKERIEQLKEHCHLVFDCPFGSDNFMKLVQSASDWNLFCHHAAEVKNYKSPDFDAAAALANNTTNLKTMLKDLIEKGCRKIILTGSVFEQNEGVGSDGLRAVSPYGLSKGLTMDVFRFYCSTLNIKLGKFVIPNPFGPSRTAQNMVWEVRAIKSRLSLIKNLIAEARFLWPGLPTRIAPARSFLSVWRISLLDRAIHGVWRGSEGNGGGG